MTAQEVLKSIGTCEPARKWVGCKSIKTAWAKCERGDWLAWVCGKMLDRRELVGLLGELVSGTPRRDGRTVRDLLTDPRSIAALDACAAYARGDLTAAELHAAATAYAATAATADAYAAAAYAAYATAATADAYAAAAATAYAATAATADAYAAAAAAAYAAAYAAYATAATADAYAAAAAAAYAATATAFAAAAAAAPCAETWQSDFIRARVSWARVEAKIKELEAAE